MITYFYRYTARKDGIYDRFQCGTFTIPDGESPWEHVVSDINEKYSDNTSWDITALNRI